MMQDFQTRIGIDRSESTYRKYITIRKQVKRFLKVKYNVQDIPLNQLDLPFIESFDYHLRVARKMTDESVLSTMLVLFKVVRLALNRKLIVHPPFFGFKLKKPNFKTKDEFQRLISTPIESKSQCFIRDMFVFAAFTGLPYVDLKQLTWKEIVTEEDGSLWISTDRQKTGIPFHVKLLDIPMQIIEKYKRLTKGEYVFSMLGHGRTNYALKMTARTVITNINPFRQAVVKACNKGVLRQNLFFDFVPERVIPKRPWFSNDEIQRIMHAKSKLTTWRFTRDIFIFSTFTDIAIIDLRNLQHSNIQEMEDGSQWIILDRQKTGTTSYIPLLDIPKRILERYRDSEFSGVDGKVFTLQTHVNMNWQLKRIAKAADINKRLTFHMSRFSFATMVCLTQGVPIESLSQMMGHLSIKTTQIYAEVTRTKINEDMTNLAERIKGKYELVE